MSDTVLIALIAVIPSVIAAITTVVTTLASNGKKERKDIQGQIKDSNEKIVKRIDDVEDELKNRIVEVDTNLQNHIEVDKKISMVLLRHNIDQMYDKFMERGYITFKEMEEVEETYQAYASQGGNHIGEEKYKAIKRLPRKEDD